jgi:predicted Zn-dependent peptidase
MYFDRFFSLDEIIERIESVSAEQLQDMSQELFHPDKIAVTVLGNLDGLKITTEQLAC